jgi:hypothetical protein
VPDQPLDSVAIGRYLHEVADELPADAQHTVIVVGGALLALHGLRDSTRDVDSVQRLDEQLAAAVARVAGRHDLAPKWLNDVDAFCAAYPLEEADELLAEHIRRIVRSIRPVPI